jgi:hypothetical protein
MTGFISGGVRRGNIIYEVTQETATGGASFVASESTRSLAFVDHPGTVRRGRRGSEELWGRNGVVVDGCVCQLRIRIALVEVSSREEDVIIVENREC